jgi:hypothetical protein
LRILPEALAQFGDFQLQLFKPFHLGFQPLNLQLVSGAAIFQALVLLEEKHQRRAD